MGLDRGRPVKDTLATRALLQCLGALNRIGLLGRDCGTLMEKDKLPFGTIATYGEEVRIVQKMR